jgi:hypothetical protein
MGCQPGFDGSEPFEVAEVVLGHGVWKAVDAVE